VTKAQLTTILLYLRNACNYIEGALLTAKTANHADLQNRLSNLTRQTQTEITHIEDLRGAPGSTPPVN
jgi:hypothetical protein